MPRRTIAAFLLLCAAAAPPPPAAALSLEQLNGPLPGQSPTPPGVTPWDTLGKTTVLWNDEDTVTTLVPPEVEALDGREVKLAGFMVPIEAELPMRQFLLIEYPADCAFCAAAGTDPSRVVEVQSSSGVDWLDEQVTVSGRLEVVRNDLDRLVCADLRARILNRPQITADGFRPYVDAIELAFGADCHFAQMVKQYEGEPGPDAARRYSPGWVVNVTRTRVSGSPDPARVSTSYVERQNLTLRMQCRRFTRLTNGFSKRLRNHKAAVALYVAHYNLCRVHETLRVTPAMALGVTDRVWSIGELVETALTEQPAPLPPPRPAARPTLRVIRGGLS